MRPEGSPLDLNNLPEEYGKQALEESSTTTAASIGTTTHMGFKKKNGGKDDNAKVYECRFCSLKFCKSQALGGHMNRHRQERETETLNRARQLVFGNEPLGVSAGSHMSMRDGSLGGMQSVPIGTSPRSVMAGGGGGGAIGDQCISFRPFHGRVQQQTMHPSHIQPYLFSSNSSSPYSTTYPSQPHGLSGDCFMGHVIPRAVQSQPTNRSYGNATSTFTCYGNPIVHSFPGDGVRAPSLVRDSNSGIQLSKVNCGCNYSHEAHKC